MTDSSTPPATSTSLSAQVVSAAYEVHLHLGPGWSEGVYQQALVHELTLRHIPYQAQAPLALSYKGQRVGFGRADLIVDSRIVVELKAVETLHRVHFAQLLSYLKAAGCRLGLLVNFNAFPLRNGIHRVIAPEGQMPPSDVPPVR